MSQKIPNNPDWSPASPMAAGHADGNLPDEALPLPEAVERWLEDGGRALEGDFPWKTALADALGHTEWRPAEVPPQSREAPAFPGAGFLDALFLDFPFPAGKREVACHLAEDAALHEGPATTFYDLVVRLDREGFEDIHDLKRALGGELSRETAHPQGGRHAG